MDKRRTQAPIDLGFEPLEKVGQGGGGTVYRGRDPLGRPVAIKFINRSGAAEDAMERELQVAARLDHPHIAEILHHGRLTQSWEEHSEGTHFLVAEWLPGLTLKSSSHAITNYEDAKAAAIAVLSGLAHAHSRGLLHLDVKPANVMCGSVAPDWRLLDFGLAHAMGKQRDKEGSGTPAYMAPEQAEGQGDRLGPWTDIYAFGCLFWNMLCGKPPYRGNLPRLLYQHVTGAPRVFEPSFDVPPEILGFLDALLTRPWNQRPHSAALVLQSLEALGAPIPLHRGPRPWHGATLVRRSASMMRARRPELALSGQVNGVRIIGRDRICNKLWSSLQVVKTEGTPKLVTLDGPRGVGAQRLGRWMLEAVVEAGAGTAVHAQNGSDAELLKGIVARFGPRGQSSGIDALDQLLIDQPVVLMVQSLNSVQRETLMKRKGALLVLGVRTIAHPKDQRIGVPPLEEAASMDWLVQRFGLPPRQARHLHRLVDGRPVDMLGLLREANEQGNLEVNGLECRIIDVRRMITDGPVVPPEWERPEEKIAWEVLIAGPVSVGLRHLEAVCATAGARRVTPFLQKLRHTGLVWIGRERLFWNDPTLHRRLESVAQPKWRAAWGDVLAVRGEVLSASERWLAAGDPSSGLRALRKQRERWYAQGSTIQQMEQLQSAFLPVLEAAKVPRSHPDWGFAMAAYLPSQSAQQSRRRQDPKAPIRPWLERAHHHGWSLVDTHLIFLDTNLNDHNPQQGAAYLLAAIEGPCTNPVALTSAIGMWQRRTAGSEATAPTMERLAKLPLLASDVWQERIDVWRAQAWMDDGEPDRANEILDGRDFSKALTETRAHALYVRAELARKEGDATTALNAFERAGELLWGSGSPNYSISYLHFWITVVEHGSLVDGLSGLQRLGRMRWMQRSLRHEALRQAWEIAGFSRAHLWREVQLRLNPLAKLHLRVPGRLADDMHALWAAQAACHDGGAPNALTSRLDELASRTTTPTPTPARRVSGFLRK